MESSGFRQGEEIVLLDLGITIERREILDVFDSQIAGHPHSYSYFALGEKNARTFLSTIKTSSSGFSCKGTDHL